MATAAWPDDTGTSSSSTASIELTLNLSACLSTTAVIAHLACDADQSEVMPWLGSNGKNSCHLESADALATGSVCGSVDWPSGMAMRTNQTAGKGTRRQSTPDWWSRRACLAFDWPLFDETPRVCCLFRQSPQQTLLPEWGLGPSS
ncbi:unnamed protein product [Protopolystoma xenopodis]|uniref:Uncharacterized protein n=1 Tax=Protopolystoma xenopodis TaxID=117903 RepID=A0A3S5B5U2_9PLAT|nr:unnamed protein product [Protopolystoma xenopodis]